MAAQLFGLYPRNEANDPETFITGATAMLANYPEAVARQVCDPVRGLPATSTFLPSIAEIRKACEAEMVWHDAVVKRNREREKTRAVLASHKARVGSPEHTRTVRSFRELGELWPKAPAPGAKQFSAPVAEEKPLFADRPLVSTPALADYLAKMGAPHEGEDEAIGFASEL